MAGAALPSAGSTAPDGSDPKGGTLTTETCAHALRAKDGIWETSFLHSLPEIKS